MKLPILSVSMLFTLFVNAQNDKRQVAITESSVTIQMSKFPIANFPENSIAVSNIRLVQLVRDSIKIGFAQKGFIGSVATLQTPKTLGVALQEHVKRMYKDEYKKNGAQVLWVVKNFRLGEKGLLMQITYTLLNADAYISKDGKLFTKVCSLDTVFVYERTDGHCENIEKAFKVLLKRTLLFAAELPAQGIGGSTVEQIIGQVPQQTDIPVMTDSVYREGLYMSFEEFLQNKPSVTTYEPVLNAKNEIRFVKSGQSQKDTLSIWGLCKSGEIYKNYEGSMIPIEKHGTGFIISNYIQNTNKKNRNFFFSAMTATAIGGAVGGMMAAAEANAIAAKDRQILLKTTPYITDPLLKPQAICIDMMTGEFAF